MLNVKNNTVTTQGRVKFIKADRASDDKIYCDFFFLEEKIYQSKAFIFCRDKSTRNGYWNRCSGDDAKRVIQSFIEDRFVEITHKPTSGLITMLNVCGRETNFISINQEP